MRRVTKLGHHERLLGLVVPHPSEELVLVNKSQLCARGVHQDLVDHHVGDLGVLYHAGDEGETSQHHGWEHDGVALVERVFLDQVHQNNYGDKELQVQTEHAPGLGLVVVQKVKAILEFEYLLMPGRVHMALTIFKNNEG